MTKIEWVKNSDGTQGKSWNIVTGCTKISLGCKNCYAERMAKRQVAMGLTRHERGSDNDDTWIAYSNAIDPDTGRWSGEITCRHDKLDVPLHWKKPRRIFVCSMSDLFHEDVPDRFIFDVFRTIDITPEHTYQILTKRPRRAYTLMVKGYLAAPLPDNVWLGVSVENQAAADARRQDFEATPAAVKFVSYEPALGPVDWTGWEFIDQLIFGGESGPGARPAHPDWFRNARDWAEGHGIARFFKGWGAWKPIGDYDPQTGIYHYSLQHADPYKQVVSVGLDGKMYNNDYPPHKGWHMARVGKKRADRLLDGQEHNEMPVSKQEHGKGVNNNGRAI